MSVQKILVTGATGLLGCSLVPVLSGHGHTVVTHGHRNSAGVKADLTVEAETLALLDRLRPDVIVHLAALTDVDRCQLEPQRAYALNVRSVENLVAWIGRARPDCHLVQLSSDQVYDGAGPHREAEVSIGNVYAFSKIAAEVAAARVGATVLRTNFFGRSRCDGRTSFTDWLYQALSVARPTPVFEDVLFNPMAIDTLADCIARVVASRPGGVFNLGSRGGLSKADFAFAFAAAVGLPDAGLRRARSTEATQLKAYRPHDMRMDCRRFERAMDLQLPELHAEILRIGSTYRAPA
jgi:dTDP-4-dehydrorhamnose reductase